MEMRHHAFRFGTDYTRLETVLGLLAPSTGTFALDAGTMSLPIEPDGFNDPNDLITGITYVKAAEFVGMIETLMGKEQFAVGLDRYHTRYRHGNATWQQWIGAMEEVSGQDFMNMARTWLKQTGFPVLDAAGTYDPGNRRYTLTLAQAVPDGGRPWVFPFRAALVDATGRDISETLVRVEKPTETIVFENVDDPAFLSLNRSYSFYGKVEPDPRDDRLRLQVLVDHDFVNRYIALYHLSGRELVRLIGNPGEKPSRNLQHSISGSSPTGSLRMPLGGFPSPCSTRSTTRSMPTGTVLSTWRGKRSSRQLHRDTGKRSGTFTVRTPGKFPLRRPLKTRFRPSGNGR
jgi:aminopeptidase N